MIRVAKPVALVAALLLTPSLAFAGSHGLFKKPAGVTAKANEVTSPGLWFTLKNACPGSAYAAVADNICLKSIDTAVYMTKIRTGVVAKGYSEEFDICAAAKGGEGEIMFVPSPGEAKEAVVVPVKPGAVVPYPDSFCKK